VLSALSTARPQIRTLLYADAILCSFTRVRDSTLSLNVRTNGLVFLTIYANACKSMLESCQPFPY